MHDSLSPLGAERTDIRTLYAAPARRAAPHTQIRPTILFGLLFLAAVALDRVVPVPWLVPIFGPWATAVGIVALASGAWITVWALLLFKRLGTGIMPDRPARQLVTTGPYGWSRHPMFVGFALIHAGGALLLASAWALVLLPVAVAVIAATVVQHEEAYMSSTFAIDYEEYTQRVNRWFGRRSPAAAIEQRHPGGAS